MHFPGFWDNPTRVLQKYACVALTVSVTNTAKYNYKNSDLTRHMYCDLTFYKALWEPATDTAKMHFPGFWDNPTRVLQKYASVALTVSVTNTAKYNYKNSDLTRHMYCDLTFYKALWEPATDTAKMHFPEFWDNPTRVLQKYACVALTVSVTNTAKYNYKNSDLTRHMYCDLTFYKALWEPATDTAKMHFPEFWDNPTRVLQKYACVALTVSVTNTANYNYKNSDTTRHTYCDLTFPYLCGNRPRTPQKCIFQDSGTTLHMYC